MYFSYFWRLEVWARGVGRRGSFRGLTEKDLPEASLLDSGALPAIFGLPWVLTCHPDICLPHHVAFSLCPNFLLVRTAVILDKGPP